MRASDDTKKQPNDISRREYTKSGVCSVHKLVIQAHERRERAKLEARRGRGSRLPAKASSNAAEQVVDESRNASLIALTSDEAGVRWEMLQEVQEKMFKDAEEETMNPRARNSDTREVGEINSLNRVNLRENTLNSRWADDVQRFERIDNRVGTGDAAVFFVW